jgi:rubrerythrin
VIEKLTLERAVEFAIKTEQLGAAFYSKLATAHAEDAELKQMLELLARDEEVHEAQFRSLRDRLPDDAVLGDDDEEYLRAIAVAEIFHGGHAALDSGAVAASREDVLARAFELEKTTVLYYEAMRKVLGPSDVLDAILEAERRHLKQVARYMLTGAKMRGLVDEYLGS